MTRNLLGAAMLAALCSSLATCALNEHNSKLRWLSGRWRAEFSGKVVWPTVRK